MEKERIAEILKTSIGLLNSGEDSYICDTFLTQKRNDSISHDEYWHWLIDDFIGNSCNVPNEYRGEYWVGGTRCWWESGKIEPRVNYLNYLISTL